jgi:putative FmdB family regulatory protein
VPIYEYRCQSCDNTFELLTTYADRLADHSCPTCESERTEVQVSTFAAQGFATEERSLPMANTGGCACGGSCGCGGH